MGVEEPAGVDVGLQETVVFVVLAVTAKSYTPEVAGFLEFPP
jgi:hypothetical protein